MYTAHNVSSYEINRFVEEVGDEVEVQWGVSLDDSLGEAVRVTIIATGYAVSDIPSLQEEAGKVSIDEAIDSNYAGLNVNDKPKEDEKPAEVDLTNSIHNSTIPPTHQNASEDGVIEITFEDDELPAEKSENKEPEPAHRFGWIRRK